MSSNPTIVAECRVCSRLQIPFPEQTESKRRQVAELFSSDKFGNYDFRPTFVPKKIEGSRYRAKFSVGGSREQPLIGFPRSDGTVIDHTDCPVHHPLIIKICSLVRELIPSYKLDPYDVPSGRGELKGIAVRVNSENSEAILRFVLRSTEAITRIRKALPAILAAVPQIVVVSANIQPRPAAVFEGQEEHILTADAAISERYCGAKFAAGPQTFSQVTPETAEVLYLSGCELIVSAGTQNLLDLYCGIGVFSILAANKIAGGTGVEVSPAAIECAALSAKLNGVSSLSFEAADCAKFLEHTAPGKFDTILANPPRRGCGQAVIERLLELSPAYLIFSSCNPQSLSADLDLLKRNYKLDSLAPFEMFPLTGHLEILAGLSRR